MPALRPTEVQIMRQALDAAWDSLSQREKDGNFKTDMAQAILQAAEYGERDLSKLKEAALIYRGR